MVKNFFFSSRRRHTRWPRDWSSDVCSSDLVHRLGQFVAPGTNKRKATSRRYCSEWEVCLHRSEERRVGREWNRRKTPAGKEKKVKKGKHIEERQGERKVTEVRKRNNTTIPE